MPTGYTTPATATIDATVDGRTATVRVKGVQVLDWTDRGLEYIFSTDVYRGGRGGTLSVKALTGLVGLSAASDLCGQSIVHQGSDGDCRVLTTSAGPARVSSSPRQLPDGTTARIYYAAVVYDGLTILVQETQFSGAALGSLPEPIFTEPELAEFAANPAFKP